ncbi:hypothetical protein [Mesorhizobium sp. M0047]|uniref:hypothetical protein n=1 Tax=Mesorhizobium sp. M0047 TaxID=2956859 RepID=UPI00333808B6
MTRQDLLLMMLASANGQPFTPVQIQKAMFLVSRNIPATVSEGPGFNFVPYDYGPFDTAVYNEANALSSSGFAIITPSGSGRWSNYSVSGTGQARGQELLQLLEPPIRDYIQQVATWVRSQSFGSLVKSIYNAYPDTKVNSIFRD